MATTFQKRQKEMKRLEKRKMKEEKRAQRKMERDALKESGHVADDEQTILSTDEDGPADQP
jgi:hypothetical protein